MALTEREPSRETVSAVIWPAVSTGGEGEDPVEGEDGVLSVNGEHEMSDPRRRFLGDDGMQVGLRERRYGRTCS